MYRNKCKYNELLINYLKLFDKFVNRDFITIMLYYVFSVSVLHPLLIISPQKFIVRNIFL